MTTVENELTLMIEAVRDATEQLRKAKSVIERQEALIAGWKDLAQRGTEALKDLTKVVKAQNDNLAKCKERMLEQAVTYEGEQLYYSHPDSKNHELCRIANERLNGVYAVMPTLFGMSQRECIELVRDTHRQRKEAAK